MDKKKLARARSCADDFIRRHHMCGGCPYSSVCGIGAWSAKKLAELLQAVDPDGLNIAVIPLAPIGGHNAHKRAKHPTTL